MLCLSRMVGQSIIIAGNIEVRVISVSGGHVRLGVAAPREITVHRDEVHKRITEGVKREE